MRLAVTGWLGEGIISCMGVLVTRAGLLCRLCLRSDGRFVQDLQGMDGVWIETGLQNTLLSLQLIYSLGSSFCLHDTFSVRLDTQRCLLPGSTFLPHSPRPHVCAHGLDRVTIMLLKQVGRTDL